MMQGQHRTVCDCSRPATIKLGSVWVCQTCFDIDSARMCRERELRERQRQERRNKLRDEFAPSADFYTFAGNRR
jgi:hypothetical protein